MLRSRRENLDFRCSQVFSSKRQYAQEKADKKLFEKAQAGILGCGSKIPGTQKARFGKRKHEENLWVFRGLIEFWCRYTMCLRE